MSDEKDNKTKDMDKIWRTISQTLISGSDRHSEIQDPMMRNMLFMDKLFTAIEVGIATIKNFDDEYDQETKLLVDRASSLVKAQMSEMQKWVTAPMYSPDHPFGANYAEHNKKSFKNNDDALKRQYREQALKKEKDEPLDEDI
jgi:hypothetical protein